MIIRDIRYYNLYTNSRGKCYISACGKYFLKEFNNKHNYLNETKLSKLLKGNKGFIPIVDNFYTSHNYYISYKYYENINLYTTATETKLIDDKILDKVFYNCVTNLEKIHNLGYIHLDIKPENYLLVNNDINDVRLIDLEFCEKMIGEDKNIFKPRGTQSYIAPEVYNNFVSYKTDVWGLGLVYYVLKSKTFPFCQIRNLNRECISKNELLQFCKTDDVTKNILDMTIVKNYNERCSLSDLKYYIEKKIIDI